MSTQTSVVESPAIINGLDVNAALATIAAIKADKSPPSSNSVPETPGSMAARTAQ